MKYVNIKKGSRTNSPGPLPLDNTPLENIVKLQYIDMTKNEIMYLTNHYDQNT